MKELFENLRNSGADIDGALRRFSNNEALFEKCLLRMNQDTSIAALNAAIDAKDFDAMEKAAHALKGISGNLGLSPLYETVSEVVALLRAGENNEAITLSKDVKQMYDDVLAIINSN